ncbi:MAG TPA: PmoA family protein [Planctomycetota bacterium]|nr:PmoA family protein [Planctomycetota bacterium]
MRTLLLLFFCLSFFSTIAGETTITVDAGALDRRETITSFALPKELGDGPFRLRDSSGAALPLQVDVARTARFVLPELKAGATKTFTLEKDTEARKGGVSAVKNGSLVEITFDGKKIISYQAEKSIPPEGVDAVFARGGYIHPVYTPSGKIITDDYPADHRHHHGIWMPWTKTEFEGRKPDFWNMGGKTGTVEHVSLNTWRALKSVSKGPAEPRPDVAMELWSGPVFAGFNSALQHIDLTSGARKTVLHEDWTVNVYAAGSGAANHFLFDFVSTQECVADAPLKLPKYHYGGLGFRGHIQWNGPPNCFFLTSEGKTRADGNETRGRWCHVGGKIDGALYGLAILGHPENFRAPQPMRLNPKEPFFCFAPSQLGDWEITPGKPYVSRYRFIVADGGPDAKEIERHWNDYATPPVVTVK